MENGVNGGGGSVFARNLQSFVDIFSPPDTNSTAFKSTGGGGNGMAATASGGFPFTSAQRKEFDRQAMIYKYMMASMPVPADLLFPTASNPSISLAGGDPHLERCKRTDGKKWRCSRDVVPLHKYCERHLQKSRPRSRKPVEFKNNGNNNNKKSHHFFNPKTDLSTISTSSCKKSERGSALMEAGMAAGKEWQHLVDASVGFGDEGSIYSSIATVFHRDYVQQQQQQPLNTFSYTNFPASEDDLKCESNRDLVFLWKQAQNETPTEAWSDDYLNNKSENVNFESSFISAQGNLSMDMGAGSALDEEMRKNDSRMLCPFAQGGPLAEALRPGPGGGCSNPASPYDNDSISN